MSTMIRLLVFAGSLLAIESAFAYKNCSDVPDKTAAYNFTKACFKHDVCYSEHPLTGFTKSECDKQFFYDMKTACRGRSILCTWAANSYYLGVRMMDNDVFTSAGRKGHATADKIEAAKDTVAADKIIQRADAQREWIAKNRECLKEARKRDYENCIDRRNDIRVPDIPSTYALGRCNMFGMNWTNGDRKKNAFEASRRTGLPLNAVLSPKGPDPCEGHWSTKMSSAEGI